MRTLLGSVARGVLAGLVGGLLLLALQAAARLLLGVSPPAELVGDRIAPLLTIDQFFGLFGLLGGYNGLKQSGILGGSIGQLAAGTAIAVAVALAARRSARRARRLLVILTAAFLLLAVAVLWPNLGTNYIGLAPGAARVLTLATMLVTFALLGVTIAVVLRVLGAQRAAPPDDRPAGRPTVARRAVLIGGVAVVGAGLAAATGTLGATLYRRAVFDYDGLRVGGPVIDPVTPNEKFYTVTKNVVDPRVDPGRWSFTVDGAVATPRTWDLATLRAMPQTTQETTLMCISNGVGDGLMSNAVWTGVPLVTLIDAAGASDRTVEVLLTAVDGYTDTFAISKAMDPTTLLAFGMNGVDLPTRHGFPARLVVPGLFGEKNLKWITRVELVTTDRKGFYETQGWGPSFEVPNRSKITSLTAGARVRRQDTTVLSGVALGGNRGVSRVEVSVDGGDTWRDAAITYPGTLLTWSLWSYDWRPATAGPATLVVRMTDRAGGLQSSAERGVVPMGATGYHRVDVTVA